MNLLIYLMTSAVGRFLAKIGSVAVKKVAGNKPNIENISLNAFDDSNTRIYTRTSMIRWGIIIAIVIFFIILVIRRLRIERFDISNEYTLTRIRDVIL